MEPKFDWRRLLGRCHGYPSDSLPSYALALSHSPVSSLSVWSIDSPWWWCPRNGRLPRRYDRAYAFESLICARAVIAPSTRRRLTRLNQRRRLAGLVQLDPLGRG